MKISFNKKDFIFIILLLIVLLIISSNSYSVIESSHKYLDGFIKFSILATMGEMLSARVSTGQWQKTLGLFWRMVLWGFLGICLTLMFLVFNEGVIKAQQKGLLLDGNLLITAFFSSAIMNLTFGPVMMAVQRIGTTYIDIKYKLGKINLKKVLMSIDWVAFLSFEVLITIPFIWIPANTITFLMPEKIRILTAALLSMILGLVLTLGKRKNNLYKNI